MGKNTDTFVTRDGTRRGIGQDDARIEYAELFRLPAGTVINRRYRILEKREKGGCGFVFKATDLILNSPLAIKFIKPKLVSDSKKFLRVKREITLSRKITDKRIVKIFSLEKWHSLHFLVMEWVEGKSLKDILEQKKSFQWQEFRPIYFEILESIAVLHREKIIHRDLKPANIILTDSGSVKILDFGLAKEITDKEKTSSIGELVGSPYYMSPEQVWKESDVDHRSDIYALGVILYRALVGVHPFQDAPTLELIYKQIHAKPDRESMRQRGIPKLVQYGIVKSLDKKKDKRFQGIEEMVIYYKSSKIPVSYRFFSRRRHPFLTVSFLAIAITVVALIILINPLSTNFPDIYQLEKAGGDLTAKDSHGDLLWQQNFSPYIITHLYPDPSITGLEPNSRQMQIDRHSAIYAFLTHHDKTSFLPTVSLQAYDLDSRLVRLDHKGRILLDQSIIQLARIECWDFSRASDIVRLENTDTDGDGRDEKLFMVRHARGMYPSALCLIKGEEIFSFSNPGGIDGYWVVENNPGNFTFYVFGFNNILSHSLFFAEIRLDRQHRSFTGIPNLDRRTEESNYEFLVILPRKIDMSVFTPTMKPLSQQWRKGKPVSFINIKTGDRISLHRDHTMTVESERGKTDYFDPPDRLRKTYRLLNQCYQARIIDKDLTKAYTLAIDMLNQKVENPYLLSVLLYIKGDLEVYMGKYKKADASLQEALAFNPANVDAAQRICEMEFLTGSPAGAIDRADNEFGDLSSFWGLGSGNSLFKIYCYLHMGNFAEAEALKSKIINKPHNPTDQYFHAMFSFFKGYLREASYAIKEAEKSFVYIFSVLEVRLLSARARLTAADELDLAKFYFEDIAKFSRTKAHLAKNSLYFLMAREGQIEEVENKAKIAFNDLMERSKADFETRLWLFYDAHVYAQTMEFCGNKAEAMRGYRICLEANPYHMFARIARARLKE